LQFRSEGPIGGVVADAHPSGGVRGYVHVPQIQFPLADVQRLAHAALGRRGAAHLVRESEQGLSQGKVSLVTGGIDRDVEALISASDGERGAMGLGVFIEPSMTGDDATPEASFALAHAHGALVMALPDADPYAFDDVARRVRSLSATPWRGDTVDLLRMLVGDYRHETMLMQDVRFECLCSTERVAGVLSSLGAPELRTMAQDPGFGQVVCHFCNHAYRFEADALLLMADGLEPIQDLPLGEA
jgi:molecular chaperone Hsp33